MTFSISKILNAELLLKKPADGSQANQQARVLAVRVLMEHVNRLIDFSLKRPDSRSGRVSMQRVKQIKTLIREANVSMPIDSDKRIKEGSIVKYKNPVEGEDMYDGYPVVYRVLEDRGDRVLMEVLWYKYDFHPQHVALKDDLTPSFSQHADVNVPAWLDFEEWQDSSWHNDATASVLKKMPDDYEIRVWFYNESTGEDSCGEGQPWVKYVITLTSPEGWGSEGDSTNSDEEIIKLMADYVSNIAQKIEEANWL